MSTTYSESIDSEVENLYQEILETPYFMNPSKAASFLKGHRSIIPEENQPIMDPKNNVYLVIGEIPTLRGTPHEMKKERLKELVLAAITDPMNISQINEYVSIPLLIPNEGVVDKIWYKGNAYLQLDISQETIQFKVNYKDISLKE